MTAAVQKLRRMFQRAASLGLGVALLAGEPDRPENRPAPAVAVSPEDEKINAALRADAARRAEETAFAFEGPYAPVIRRMQEDLDRHYLENPNPFFDRAVVVDVEKVDVMMAMGLPLKEALGRFFRSRGLYGIGAEDMEKIGERLAEVRVWTGEDVVMAVSPAVRTLARERLCVLVPPLAYGMFLHPDTLVPGMTVAETLAYAEEHEKWHAKDRAYDSREVEKHERLIRWADLRGAAEDPGLLNALSVAYRKEVLADAGGLGDMVREQGYPPGIISLASRHREEMNRQEEHLHHYSSPALDALSLKIWRMGLPAFRAMDDTEAEGLYVDTVEGSGLATPEALGAYVSWRYGAAADRRRAEEAGALLDPGTRGAVAMAKADHNLMLALRPPGQPAPRGAVAPEVTAWNPRRALEEKAFAARGRLTPGTLLAAYAALQEELLREMALKPASLVAPQKALKLRTFFAAAVDTTDFAAANRARGVTAPKLSP